MKIYRLLSESEAREIAGSIESMDWLVGQAGNATGTVKNNKELKLSDNEPCKELLERIHQRIRSSRAMTEFYVEHVMVPKFNRFDEGDAYHSHADAGLMGGVFRTDLAATVFLTDNYDGGELCVNGLKIKGVPGTMVVYECWRPHHVNPVTRGSRVCAITWAQSLIRDYQNIEVLRMLADVLKDIDRSGSEERFYSRLSAVYGKLIRKWVS